jgi:phytanoyl-CoA hydroxylase
VSSSTLPCATSLIPQTGKLIGQEIEAEFFRKAEKAGFTDEEAKNAFNCNMMATGLLSESPSAFATQFNRRWLVSSYEAGDVVLHDAFAVSLNRFRKLAGDGLTSFFFSDPRFNNKS